MKPVVIGGDDFRPVGIAVAPNGWLYVSDWVDKSYDLHGKGRIWRLRSVQPPDPFRFVVTDRWLKSVLTSRAATGRFTDEHVASFLHDADADIRALAVRIVPAARMDLKAIAASDASPLVRSEAMRRLADPAAKDILLKALESDDPFLQQAARQGLRRSLKTSEMVAIAGSKDLAPARRLGLLLILRDSDQPEARALLPMFLSDRDPSIRFAAIQWVGEHRLTEFRPQLTAALASSAATRILFEGTLAALELLDNKLRGPREEVAGEDYIAALLKDPQTPAVILERGLRMLRPDHPALTIDRLRRFLTRPEEAVRIEAVRSLSQGPLPGRFALLAKLADDRGAAAPLRAEAIAGLADDAIRQRDRLLALAADEQPVVRREALRGLRGTALTEGERSRLRTSSRVDAASLALIDSLGAGEAATVARAGRDVPLNVDVNAWLARLEGPADAAAGERVFFHSKGPGCFRCHQIEGRGGRAGPDLSTLAGGVDRRRLVESILTPSKEIAPQFVTWSIARTDGIVFTGILLEQSPEGMLVFGGPEGRLIAIKAGEIAERKPQAASIMPDNLAQTMTIEEFRDLLAFLGRQK